MPHLAFQKLARNGLVYAQERDAASAADDDPDDDDLLSPRRRFAMRWAAVFAGVRLDTLCWPRLVCYASRGLPLRRAHKQRPSNGS